MEKDKERGEKVQQWYKGLGLEEAAQTITEHNETDSKLLRQMVEKRKAAGEGVFFHETSGNVPLFKKFSSLEMHAGNTFFYTERTRESERKLVSCVRLCDTRVSLDTITVTTDVLVDRDAFLSLLSVVSQGGFLSSPCMVGYDQTAKEWKWDAPDWFGKKGYYTIGEYLAQWIEKIIWRRYFESNRIDPRKVPDRTKMYKASTNTQLSTQAVLDPRKGRLKSFWHGLTDEEREKLSDVKVGQVMAKVVASEEKVDYLKMLKTLQKLTNDKATKENCFDDKLRKDPVQYIEYLYLSSLEIAGKVREKVLRHIGDTLQNACAEKLAMDLINSEEQAKSKPPHHSDSVRFSKKKKNRRKKPLTSPSMPLPMKEKMKTVDLLVLNSDSDIGDNSESGEGSTSNNNVGINNNNNNNASIGTNGNSNALNTTLENISITRRKEKKKKNKKKKQGGRGNGTMSASDAQQRANPASSPSSNRTRRHRYSLPEDFAQTNEEMLAKIRAGADPTDYEDDEEVETVSDGEINEREPALAVGREIVALSDEDLDDDDFNEPPPKQENEVKPPAPRREKSHSEPPARHLHSSSPSPSPSPSPSSSPAPPTTSNFKRSSSSNAISEIAKNTSGSTGGFTSVTGRRQRNASFGSYPTGSTQLSNSSSTKSSSGKTQSSPRGQQSQAQQAQQQQSKDQKEQRTPHHPRSLSVSAPTIHTPATLTNPTAQQQQPYQTQRNTKYNAKQSLAIQALSLHESHQQSPPHPRIRDIHAQTLAQLPPTSSHSKPYSTTISKPFYSAPASFPLKSSSAPSPSPSATISTPKLPAKSPASYASAVAPALVPTAASFPLLVPSSTQTSSVLSSSSSAPSLLASVPVVSSSTTTTTTSVSSVPTTTLVPSLAIPLPISGSSSIVPVSSASILSSSTPSSHSNTSSSTHLMSTSAPTNPTYSPSSFYKSLSSSALSDMLLPAWAGHYFPYSQYYFDLSLQLHHEMVDYVNYINGMAHSNQIICQLTISRVAAVVTRLWPASRVEVFGSFASGLWMPSSDIDLVIVGVNYGARGQIGPQTTQFLLQILERELEKEPWVLSIQSIPLTRVPVMKLVSKEGNVPIDITFSETSTHHTGIASRNLVKQHVSSLPALAPLALVLKTFLRERGLNNTYTGGLSSYCLVLMIIAFLNHHYLSSPPLPPGSPATETSNWGILLLGFLTYYGKDFDYKTTGISISPGRSTFPLPISSFSYSIHHSTFNTNPTIMESLEGENNTNQLTEDSNAETTNDSLQFPLDHSLTHSHSSFSITPPMYLEDPIRKGNNIGSHAFLLNRVQAAFEFAKNALKDAPHATPSLLSRILNTRPCDISPCPPLIIPHHTYSLPSVRSLPM